MSQIALVTGASSGIGQAIAQRLLEHGYEVYGIGRNFSACTLTGHALFHTVVLDLLDTPALLAFLETLPKDNLSVLVNSAGCAWYGPHETLSVEAIQTMTRVNLETPILLCGKLLRTLKQNHGTIINIASVTALETSTHGAAYGALKAGLVHFSRTLFEEHRKSGLKVSVILPDMTDTALYRNADFGPDLTEGAYLSPEDTADAVMAVLNAREGTVLSEIVLRPQYRRIHRK
ncbi:MAG: SDR family NAD(P)-dependent oxidoreductase [Solobacterium sp.]|nr:SDR family NAD(P)-dependent oxidoreductase [Solobacterium sp.]